MQKIHVLSKEIIAKIAAGEVIERPAFAVKELIENAIDAHADTIEIAIEESGLKKITISDNGEGMNRKDLELCILPHTTSKLHHNDDLLTIKTLGFRGEALSSLATIAQKMNVKSRTIHEVGGTIIHLRLGKIEEVSPIGAPIGTTVTIHNLFHSVPARKEFLKSSQTEFRLITDIVTDFAISYSSIHFVLKHNNKTILDLPKKIDTLNRIKILMGTSICNQLIPITFEEGYLKIHGFIGKPQIASKQQNKQFIFINNRKVTDKLISLAVKESFGTLLPSSLTPIFIFHITIPPEIIDVNVHPRKEQVEFQNRKAIFDSIKQAVSETLTDNNLTFRLSKFRDDTSAKIGETNSFSGIFLKDTVLSSEKSTASSFNKNAPIIQIDTTYLISFNNDGIVLIDQHAAHERILYERFIETFTEEKNKKLTYSLARSLTLSLSLADLQLIEEYQDEFEKIGFKFEHFQGSTIIIREAPIIFKGRNLEKIIKDMLEDLSQEKSLSSIDLRTRRMLSFLSCRAAVKAGDQLTDKKMREILSGLSTTNNNSTCPHERPTRIPITHVDLQKMFKRI